MVHQANWINNQVSQDEHILFYKRKSFLSTVDTKEYLKLKE